eukprot:262784-Pyramimonas_sp.AAC.1
MTLSPLRPPGAKSHPMGTRWAPTSPARGPSRSPRRRAMSPLEPKVSNISGARLTPKLLGEGSVQ